MAVSILDLTALVGAFLAGFRHGLAFLILKEFIAFFLTGDTNLVDNFSESWRKLRINGRERLQCSTRRNRLIGQLQTLSHAGVIHRNHRKAMANVILSI